MVRRRGPGRPLASPYMVLRPLVAPLAAALLLAGCGSGGSGGGETRPPGEDPPAPVLGGKAEKPEAATDLGFPGFATKNTTRVGGGDPVADAAGVAQAVFPSRSPETRPAAVSLVDVADWRAAISAAQLAADPIGAPVLFSRGKTVPPATRSALAKLAPKGAKRAGGAQLLRVGDAPAVDGMKAQALGGADYAEQARAIDRLHTKATGRPTREVLVAPADRPPVAMAAAGLAAKSGTPVFWVRGKEVPAATRAAITDHKKPRIFLVGTEDVVPKGVADELAKLGTVKRIPDPEEKLKQADGPTTSVEFAKYEDAGFGWNAIDPGHGFVFLLASRPADAAAAAPLSAAGSYAPLLVVSDPQRLDRAVEGYLLDVQPGYERDPVRGVYNRGWLMGDAATISVDVQARIDALLEIQPVDLPPE